MNPTSLRICSVNASRNRPAVSRSSCTPRSHHSVAVWTALPPADHHAGVSAYPSIFVSLYFNPHPDHEVMLEYDACSATW